MFESTLGVALSSGDVPELRSTPDIDKYADFIITAISTAVDKAIPTSKSGCPESQLVLKESLALIKEKRRLRRQYSQAHDPLVKTCINQLQKEIKDNLSPKQAGLFRIWYSWGAGADSTPCVTSLFEDQSP